MKVFLLLFTFLYSSLSLASEIVIPDDLDAILGKKFEIILPSDHNIKDIVDSDLWEPVDVDTPNFGYMKESFWIRSHIKSLEKGYYNLTIENSLIDFIDVYIIKDGKIKDIHLSGDLRKLSTRTVPHRYTIIPMDIHENETFDIYLKIQSKGTIQLPIYIQEVSKSTIYLSNSAFLHGIFGGLIFIMVIYNFILFLAFKEKTYLFFVLFAAFTLFFQYTEYGFATEYSWGEYPIINTFIIPILIPITLMFMSLFLKHVLNVKKEDKVAFGFFVGLFLLNFLIFIGALLFDYNTMCKIATYSAAITTPCHLVITLCYSRKGGLALKIIALSLISFVAGVVTFSALKLGYIESNFLTENSLKLGQSLEILLISIALSFKINKLVHQVSHDKLTGVPNRLGFDIRVKEAFKKSKMEGSPVSLLMIDVDKFKSINDRYGHDTGDKVLIHISSIIKNVMTKYDGTVFRYGGEEFSVILSGKTSSVASNIAEDIRKEIEKTPFYLDNLKKNFTISIGCGHYNGDIKVSHYEDLIKHSDKLLYEAKNAGRNKVVSGHLI